MKKIVLALLMLLTISLYSHVVTSQSVDKLIAGIVKVKSEDDGWYSQTKVSPKEDIQL